LVKYPCEVCGEENSEAHHLDYNDPLNVLWLCKKHHREWHNGRDGLPGYNEVKTIKVSEETFEKLIEFKADFMKVHKVSYSFDEVISEVLDLVDEAK